ncbi:hypothetical protein AURDEDRAFT_166266 [Auricularia subglabra TFB-10046 SS5]|nr:hypothetical protein AURDEDRAFT_166266 [Auricularia subglabra TFB-10046 SS5]
MSRIPPSQPGLTAQDLIHTYGAAPVIRALGYINNDILSCLTGSATDVVPAHTSLHLQEQLNQQLFHAVGRLAGHYQDQDQAEMAMPPPEAHQAPGPPHEVAEGHTADLGPLRSLTASPVLSDAGAEAEVAAILLATGPSTPVESGTMLAQQEPVVPPAPPPEVFEVPCARCAGRGACIKRSSKPGACVRCHRLKASCDKATRKRRHERQDEDPRPSKKTQ